MIILTILNIVLLLTVGFFLCYLAFLSILSLIERKRLSIKTTAPVTTTRTFAVVIPAHNEEECIACTIQSALSIDYPHDKYEVIVIADNCNDQTPLVAREAGATVLERQSDDRGKGYALRWCFERLFEQQFPPDAVVIVDADSTPSSNFLNVMNRYLDLDSEAIQASDLVAPTQSSRTANAIRIGFLLYNYARPLGRKLLGFSAGLRGNGMCFSRSVLQRFPWKAYSVTEDLEYGLHLLLNGVIVRFAPEAHVWATMPDQSKNAESQRARWEVGRYPVIKRYAGRLLQATFRKRSFTYFDALVDLVMPPFVNMMGVVAFAIMLHLIGWMIGWEGALFFFVAWLSVFAAGVVHVFAGLASSGADASLYATFTQLPRYFFWKLKVYGKSIRTHMTKDWVRTTREGHAPLA